MKPSLLFFRALGILWSGVIERSVGVESWSGVETDFGVANVGHSFAPRHSKTKCTVVHVVFKIPFLFY